MEFNTQEAQAAAAKFRETFNRIKSEIQKFMVGQEDIIDHVLISVICGGNVLLEGVPGLGKTALVHTLSQTLSLNFSRIQFTPDLLPADVVGTNILVEKGGEKVFQFQQGPVFCNILLADEINRATPKTQSALLETMQERAVTVAGKTYPLDKPFFLLATQNPIEQDGTYPLPEAQLDRFFFKIYVKLPNHEEFSEILYRTSGLEQPQINPVAKGDDILGMGKTACQIPIEESIQDYLIKAVRNTHPENEDSPEMVKKYVRNGASPRAAQTILAGSRVRALLKGRYHVAREDINALAVPAMRHRLVLSFEGEADGVKPDQIIEDVLSKL